MKKIFMFLAVIGLMAFSAQYATAQDETATEPAATEQVTESAAPQSMAELVAATQGEVPLH